jgi:hypothetical protein
VPPWDENNNIIGDEKFLMTIDGTHCRINEPRVVPSKKWYSFKFAKPGLSYEVGLDVYSSKIVWINGPFEASKPDIEIFKNALHDKIPDGRKVLGDKGYVGFPEKISTYNEFDTPSLMVFKARAKSQQECLFKRAKDFKVLEQ